MEAMKLLLHLNLQRRVMENNKKVSYCLQCNIESLQLKKIRMRGSGACLHSYYNPPGPPIDYVVLVWCELAEAGEEFEECI